MNRFFLVQFFCRFERGLVLQWQPRVVAFVDGVGFNYSR